MFHLIKSKGCQRCGGDLFLEQDEYGTYVSCIQCGAVHAEYSNFEFKTSKQLAEVGEPAKWISNPGANQTVISAFNR